LTSISFVPSRHMTDTQERSLSTSKRRSELGAREQLE
jgi:hypothetical protein